MSYNQAIIKWQEMRRTMYSDETIREYIRYASNDSAQYAPANAQTALAMIAYNRMIEERIERAQKSWKVNDGM
jgi:hypothetical protein